MASMGSPVRGAGYEPSTCGLYRLLGEPTIPTSFGKSRRNYNNTMAPRGRPTNESKGLRPSTSDKSERQVLHPRIPLPPELEFSLKTRQFSATGSEEQHK